MHQGSRQKKVRPIVWSDMNEFLDGLILRQSIEPSKNSIQISFPSVVTQTAFWEMRHDELKTITSCFIFLCSVFLISVFRKKKFCFKARPERTTVRFRFLPTKFWSELEKKTFKRPSVGPTLVARSVFYAEGRFIFHFEIRIIFLLTDIFSEIMSKKLAHAYI